MRTSFDDIVAGIDRHLSYLHKERWAERHAKLRDVVRSTTGEEQERAKQAVRDHYETQAYPQTSRAALIEQARLNYDKRAAEETGTA